MSKRDYFKSGGYSTDFTPAKQGHRRYLLDRIPVGFWLDVQAKAKREGISIRALILTLLKQWLEKPTALLVFCLIFTSGTASAQSLKVATAVYASATAADMATTYYSLSQRGFHEGNPFLSWLGSEPMTTVSVYGAMSVAEGWAWNRLLGRRHPKLAALGLYVTAGVRAGVAARNIHRYRHSPTPAAPCVQFFCRSYP